mmetsp:Transcript_12151/g.38544  ORF Transcript_12151/g.38544 Transcript_12151/m.38544 type:complete len:234 (+) Transcript_12151:351-1052(+)
MCCYWTRQADEESASVPASAAATAAPWWCVVLCVLERWWCCRLLPPTTGAAASLWSSSTSSASPGRRYVSAGRRRRLQWAQASPTTRPSDERMRDTAYGAWQKEHGGVGAASGALANVMPRTSYARAARNLTISAGTSMPVAAWKPANCGPELTSKTTGRVGSPSRSTMSTPATATWHCSAARTASASTSSGRSVATLPWPPHEMLLRNSSGVVDAALRFIAPSARLPSTRIL